MARSRNIKPGFFSNEHLAELDFATRLLFIGMWTEADREGRLEDRPRRLKMALFPADNVDIEKMLADLDHLGFIARYTVGPFRAIQIVNWAKHQNPHLKEAKSTIPEMPVVEPCPVKVGASTMQAPDEHGSFPADSLSLDSGFLIPDSGFTDSPNQDQHHSLNAGEETPPVEQEQNPTVAKIAMVQAEAHEPHPLDAPQDEQGAHDPEPSPEPVDPKSPVEMTLDWVPDANLLKTYCVHFGVSTDLFTREALAPFTAHHETTGILQTQSKWVSLLVKWVKDDKNRASNIRQFRPRAQTTEPDFDSNAWAEGLVVSP